MRKHVTLEDGQPMTLVSRRGGPIDYNEDELNKFYEQWMENEVRVYSKVRKVKEVLEKDLILIDKYVSEEKELIEKLKSRERENIEKAVNKKSDELDKRFQTEIEPLRKKYQQLLIKIQKTEKKEEHVGEFEELDSNIHYGLRIQLNKIEDIRITKAVKLNVEFLVGGEIALNDLGNFTSFEGNIIDDFLDYSDVKWTLTKTEDPFDIEVDEEHFVIKDVPKVLMRRLNRKPVFLKFTLIEILKEPKLKYDKPGVRFLDSYMVEYCEAIIAETYFEVQYLETDINVGRFKIPFMKKVEKLDNGSLKGYDPLACKLDFNIETFRYNIDNVNQYMNRRNRRRRKKLRDESDIDRRPFIPNLKPQFKNNLFEKGSGVDIYVDGARYLPNSVGVTKILVRVIDSNLKDVMLPQTKLATMDSSIYQPFFEFRHELRLPYYDPTLMILLTLMTLEPDNTTKIFGYSFFPLFISKDTYQPIENVLEENFILMNGCYQIPIFCQEYYQKKPFLYKDQ